MPPNNFNRRQNIFRNNLRNNNHRNINPRGLKSMPDLSQLPVFEPLKGENPFSNWKSQASHQVQTRFQNQPQELPKNKGVASYEPVDEDTMREVRKLINAKRIEEGLEPLPEIPEKKENEAETPELEQELEPKSETIQEPVDNLCNFIQNERNASLFYKHLANVAENESHKEILSKISTESSKRSDELNGIYEAVNGKQYEIKDRRINDLVKFKEGLNLAINTESKIIRDLSDYYNTSTEVDEKKLNSIIHKKLCDIISLKLMYYKK